MLWFKTCARCKGDLYEDNDDYGRFIACLQCGHELNSREVQLLWAASQGKIDPSSDTSAKLLAFLKEAASTPPPPPIDEGQRKPRRRRRLMVKAQGA